MCKNTFLGCLLSEESFFLFSNYGVCVLYPGLVRSRWKHLAWSSCLSSWLISSANAVAGRKPCVQPGGRGLPPFLVVVQIGWRPTFLSTNRPGCRGVYFFFTSRRCYLSSFTFSAPWNLVLPNEYLNNQDEKVSLSQWHSGIIGDYTSLAWLWSRSSIVALGQGTHDYVGRWWVEWITTGSVLL